MSRLLKDLVVKELKQEFTDIDTAVVVSFTGVSNQENTKLRADLRDQNVRLRLVKNRLAKLSFQGSPLEPLNEYLAGPAAIVYIGKDGDATAVPKAICPWEKKAEGVSIIGGVLEGRSIGAEEIIALSKLPSRTELLGQIVGCLQSPLVNIANLLTSPLTQILGLLDAYHEKRQGEES